MQNDIPAGRGQRQSTLTEGDGLVIRASDGEMA
jgi:hypothetical protein